MEDRTVNSVEEVLTWVKGHLADSNDPITLEYFSQNAVLENLPTLLNSPPKTVKITVGNEFLGRESVTFIPKAEERKTLLFGFTEPSVTYDPAMEKRRSKYGTVTFTYCGTNRKTEERTVDVVKVYEKDGCVYVSGFCHLRGEIRSFKAGNILSDMICGEEVFPLNEWITEALGK